MPSNFNYEEFIAKDSKEVFELISNFEDYKNFLPGCTDSEILSRTKDYDIGRLNYNFFNKDYFIESRNSKMPTELNIKQLKGPFNSLDASWKVVEKDLGCLVIFSVEFNAPILLRPFMQQSLIDTFASKFISAFLKKVS
jgi:ribosome-associated toxin RatA of RatAB toxin-antitoxin module